MSKKTITVEPFDWSELDKCPCGKPTFDGEKYCESCRIDRAAMKADDRRE